MSDGEELDLGPEGGTRAWSVTEFTRRVKALLEGGLRPGWVRGEVSNLRIQASGHAYFSLKDAGAQLRAVMFRGDAARQTARLREGGQALVYGEVSVYEARGEYQLIVRAVVDDGVGRLRREFEALKARLAAEGLFDRERKRPLPRLPRTIGLATSPTGAAAQDFLRILARRGWRGRVVVLPAKVQGEGAAEEIAARLAQANDPAACGIKFDLLVVTRGGGSLEDLWAFNEEPLVRAVAGSRLPVISAVGHEIDFTLCDFAADARAETPSGAAELISSGYVAETERLDRLTRGLRDGTEAALAEARDRLGGLRARLRLLTPAAQVEREWLRLDDLRNRMEGVARRRLQACGHGLELARARLAAAGPQRRVERESQRLLALWKRLQAASPDSVLNRGFAILRDAEGRVITRSVGVAPGDALRIRLADGEIGAKAE